MNTLDKLIAWVSPSRGLGRVRARMQIDQVRRYDGATTGRRTQSWLAQGSSANTEIAVSLPKLRDRHRELIRNNPWAARAKQAVVSHTIGFGITSKLDASKAVQKKWLRWADTTECDALGRHNWYGLQALIMGIVVESGSCLIRRRWRRPEDGLSVPMQLQVLEPDYIDHSKTELLNNGTRIIQGVEFDSIGRRVAYWLFSDHPGDISGNVSESKRVPANDVLEIYRQERSDQVHGVPWGAPCMITLRDLDDYEDAYLFRQKIANCQVGAIYDTAANFADTTNAAAGGAPLAESFEPGRWEMIPPGKDVKFNTPPNAGDYGPFVRDVLLRVAATYGITYGALTGDLSAVNFSSGRMGHLDMSRNIAQWQWNMLVPQLLDPVVQWFGEALGFTGTKLTELRAKHGMPRRDIIDPAKEYGALNDAIRAGLTSLPAVHRELGEDFAAVLEEIAESNQMIDKLQLKLDSDPRADTVRLPKTPAATQDGSNA